MGRSICCNDRAPIGPGNDILHHENGPMPEPDNAFAEVIVNYAKANNCEHIVLGTGVKSTIARMVLGSVSSEVLVRAHCSVTIAR